MIVVVVVVVTEREHILQREDFRLNRPRKGIVEWDEAENKEETAVYPWGRGRGHCPLPCD